MIQISIKRLESSDKNYVGAVGVVVVVVVVGMVWSRELRRQSRRRRTFRRISDCGI